MKKSAIFGLFAVAVAAVTLVAVTVQSQPIGVTPVPAPNPHPVRPIPIGPGGTYTGPGDTVPPGGGGTGGGGACANLNCTSPSTVCGAGRVCPVVWRPRQVPGCYNCSCDDYLHPIISYDLSFDALLQLCNTACVDTNGDITVRVTIPSACDAQVFMSNWLVYGAFTGFPTMPPVGSVVVSPCVNGNGLGLLGDQCVRTRASGCIDCNDAVISFTFNRDCMCSALTAWVTVLSAQGVPYASYKNNWMLNVSATSCMICE